MLMTRSQFLPLSFVMLLLAATMLTTGCASTGGTIAPGDTAANEMTRTHVEVAAAGPLLANAMNALDTLIATSEGELREPYDAFRVAVGDITAHERRMNRQVDRMRGQRDRFLRSWRADSQRLESEELRNRAEHRAVQVEQRYALIEDRLRQFDDTFSALASKFRDLERFIGNDLTAGGLSSVRTMRGPIRADLTEANSALNALLEEMGRLSGDLSPVLSQPAATTDEENEVVDEEGGE